MITVQQIETLHKKYAPNQQVYNLVYGHCQIVNEIALWCAQNAAETIDTDLLSAAALLHDIGSYVLFDDEGRVTSRKLYPLHAILGSKIIADEGIDKRIAQIVETHVVLGLTKQEIIDRPWSLPVRDYIPSSIEGELLCYADRFHSKKPVFNAYESLLTRMKEEIPLQASKFQELSARFGIPDVQELASRHGQLVK